MSDLEHEVREKLSDIPPVPPEMFDSISSAITRRKKTALGIRTLAILLVAGLSVFSYLNFYPKEKLTITETQTEKIVEDELQIVHDYLQGENITMELEEYAVLDPMFFPDVEEY